MATWAERWQAVTAPLRRNVVAKIFAAVFAFVLWLFVNAGERDTQTFQFPVEFRNAPQRTVLAPGMRIDTVAVKLNGPAALLASLDARRAPIVVDLSRVTVGSETRVKIRDEMVRVPRGVRILEVQPNRVPLLLEEVQRATIPVSLVATGEPRDGYRVKEIKAIPDAVTVTGPASTVRRLKAVDTEPIDLADIAASTQRTVFLARGDDLVGLKPERVSVDIAVERVLATRVLDRVPIEVRNVDLPFQVRPQRVKLTVRGPERQVQDLDLPAGSVFLDGTDIGAGEHTLTPEVALPAEVEVIKTEPATVRLTIQEPKDGTRR